MCGLRRNANLTDRNPAVDVEIKKQFWASKKDLIIRHHVQQKVNVVLS